jgi:hypothetical protein
MNSSSSSNADSYAASLAGSAPTTLDDDFAELADMLTVADTYVAPGRPKPAQPKPKLKMQTRVVSIEDRANEQIEIQNFIKAIDIVGVAESSAISAKLLTEADVLAAKNESDGDMSLPQLDELYACDAECAHSAETDGSCSAVCRQWQPMWAPIMNLLGEACNDNATTFSSLPTATTAISSLTNIQSTFAALIAESARTANASKFSNARIEFPDRVYQVLCTEIGAEFHQVRETIRNQMCCVDAAADKVSQLVRQVMTTFEGDGDSLWLTKNPTAMGLHLKKCKPEHMATHIQTLDNTGDQLAGLEKEVFKLAAGCTDITTHMRSQLEALRASMPSMKASEKRKVADWVRTPPTDHSAHLDVWSECVYGHNNCSADDFLKSLRAFLDTEPNCSLLVYDGVVFFRDCYADLAWCMEQHLKRTEEMRTAFLSLGQALVQQRFIVLIGAFLLRTLIQAPLRTIGNKKETPVDIFGILLGPRFQPSLASSDFIQIQIELDSNGDKLPGTLRSYLLDVYTTQHLDAIQEAARAMFTAELDSLGTILTAFQARNGLAVADTGNNSNSIVEMRRLVQAVVMYMEKKHPCTTKHCDCCQASKK